MARARGKAKARNKTPRPQPVQAAPPPPPPAPPPPPPAVEAEPAPPEPAGHGSRAAQIGAVAIVAASTALTFLLLSGWTPGPHQSTPQTVAAAAPTPKPKPRKAAKPAAKPNPKPKKKVVATPPTVKQISRETFQGQCGFCHTLADAGTTGRVGPNLDRLKPTKQRVLNAIAVGGRRTGLMPPDIIDGTDATRVAAYVAKVSRR